MGSLHNLNYAVRQKSDKAIRTIVGVFCKIHTRRDITTDLTSGYTVKYHLNDDSLGVTNLDQFSPHYSLLSGSQED